MTEREQIEQRIAENERRIAEGERKEAELQRNMIEQERNMAKQIKDLLDKGISKADMAKATEFSLEYIDTLLDKYFPSSTKETNVDFQTQLDFLKQQIHILQTALDNKESELLSFKEQIYTLQTKGENMSDTIETTQGIQQWEYTESANIPERLNKLGEEGWEAVGLNNNKTLLKRPKPEKKQQTTDYYGYGR